jgi:antitoxin HigA-1
MELSIEMYKGIHPGIIIDSELKKRNLKKGPFALSLQEYPQTLNDITKGKRGLTPALSLKIDSALGLEEGTMLILQAYYEIKKEKQKSESGDKTVIQRVFERGNDDEKKEILRFYGKDKIKAITGNTRIANNKIWVKGRRTAI